MLKEIFEQPKGLSDTLNRRLDENGKINLEGITLTKEQIDIILSPQEMTQPGIAGKEVLEETYLAQQKISG